MKRAVALAVARRQEVGDADIYADHWSRGFGLCRDYLVIRESQPPAVIALIDGHAGIDGLALKGFAVVGCQLDGHQQLLAEFQGADLEPVVKGRVLRGFKDGDVDVGLDTYSPQHRDIPLVPDWF